jgi:septum formation protein
MAWPERYWQSNSIELGRCKPVIRIIVSKLIAPILQLASTSSRRREILASLGFRFDVVEVETDERPLNGELPSDLVLRLATAKAEALNCGNCVLGADTVVVLGDRVFGKPRDAEDAVSMLLSLSGCRHTVLTGVALKTPNGTRSVLSSTDVQFREIGQDEALRYWQSGEPADKAGSYGIQGLGGMFVKAISGSYSGVMGLPVFETIELLASAGIDVLEKQR